jgi:hypothetical protein
MAVSESVRWGERIEAKTGSWPPESGQMSRNTESAWLDTASMSENFYAQSYTHIYIVTGRHVQQYSPQMHISD